MGAGHAAKIHHVIRVEHLSQVTSAWPPPGRAEWLVTKFNHVPNDFINHAYIIKSPLKHWTSNLVSKHNDVPLRRWWILIPWNGQKRLCLGPFQILTIWSLSYLILICILHNKTLIISIAFSWFWVVVATYWIWRGNGNPQVCIKLIRNAGGLGNSAPAAGVWTEDISDSSCCRLILIFGVRSKSGWLASELHYSIAVRKPLNTGVRTTGKEQAE